MFEQLLFNTIIGRKTVLSVILCLYLNTTSLYCGLLKIANFNPERMRDQYNPSKNSIRKEEEKKRNRRVTSSMKHLM